MGIPLWRPCFVLLKLEEAVTELAVGPSDVFERINQIIILSEVPQSKTFLMYDFRRIVMKKVQITTVILLAAFLVGCASTVLESMKLKGYTIGNQVTAPIGVPFLVDQDGSIEVVKTWVGIIESPNGWKIEKRYSEDFIRKELIYSGGSGGTIEISYREFRGGFAAPAFYQNLKYDLSQSKLITFQNFQIEIINTDNQSITYMIVKD